RGLASYRVDYATVLGHMGEYLANDGSREAAEAAFRRASAIFEKLIADFPAIPIYREGFAQSENLWSKCLEKWGEQVEAEAACQRAVDLYTELVRQFPAKDTYRQSLSSCAQQLAHLMTLRGASSESIAAVWRIQEWADIIDS